MPKLPAYLTNRARITCTLAMMYPSGPFSEYDALMRGKTAEQRRRAFAALNYLPRDFPF